MNQFAIRSSAFVAVASALAFAGSANAALTVYTSLASFNAATSNQGTDTFAGFNITGTTAGPLNRSAGIHTYTTTTTPSGLFFGAGTIANPWLSTNTATDAILFNNFSAGVQGVGGNFFGSNIAGAFAAGDVTVTAVDSSGSSVQSIIGATTSSFLGFVTDGSLVSLTVSAVQPAGGNLWPTVDNFVLANAVPAPGAIALLGLAGLVGGRRRRA